MNHPQEMPVRERVSAEEWEMRVNLAAAYRCAAHLRMTDLIYTSSRHVCRDRSIIFYSMPSA